MLSEIISDIVCEHAQETHFFVQNTRSAVFLKPTGYKLFLNPESSLKLSNTVNMMNVQLDISLSVWPKKAF